MGAWAFLLHRIAGVVIALYGISHVLVISSAIRGVSSFDQIMNLFQKPWILSLELLLLAAILYHILNGLRVTLFDLGVGLERQKPLFWGLMALGAVVFFLVTLITLPYILGRPLT